MKQSFFFKISLGLGIFLMSYTISSAGGWTKKKNEGFFKLSQYVLRADKFYNFSKEIVDIRTTSVYTTSVYGEYGLSNKVTVIGYVPFIRSTINELQKRDGTTDEGDEFNGLGDINIGLKYGLISNSDLALSASLTLGIPSGEPAGGTSQLLQSGDGEFNQMLTIEASHSFYPKNVYASVALAFNNRTKDFSDEIRYGVEVGYGLKDFWFIGRINAVNSLMNGDGGQNGAQGIFGNNVEYFSISPEVVYKITERVGVSASIAGALDGRQILANPAFDVGIFLDMK